MGTPSGGSGEEFVFDDDFVAAASFKEPSVPLPKRRRRPRLPRFLRLPRLRRPRIGARGLTLLIILLLVALAAVLSKLDPLGLRPQSPEIRITVVPSPASPQPSVPSTA